MLKNLFDKCVKLASSKLADYALGFVAFIESFFFPVPPDLMIVPMVVAKKENYLKIFLIATIFSVLGGMLGYILGAYFFDFALLIVDFYGYENKMLNLKNTLEQGEGFYAWLVILFLAGFTPLPYKVFTIVSGLLSFNFPIFVLISLVSRGLRFFIVSFLSFKFGDAFTKLMNKHGSKWFSILGIIIIIFAATIYLIFKFYD